MPIAFADFIHFCSDNTKKFKPDSILNWSNLTSLKLGLLSCSHKPRYSIVDLTLSQFLIVSAGKSEILYLAISVKEIFIVILQQFHMQKSQMLASFHPRQLCVQNDN